MQNYSQALDLDMLNRRYWHRRMQQCKAEFKKRQPQPINSSSSSPSFSDKLQSPSSKDWSGTDSSTRPTTKPIVAKSITSPLGHQPTQVEPSFQADPEVMYREDSVANGSAKGRPIPSSSKPSRPIKYQVR